METGDIMNVAMLREHNRAKDFIQKDGKETRNEFNKLRAATPGARTPFFELVEFLLWLKPVNACAMLDSIPMNQATVLYPVIEGRALGMSNEVARQIVERSKKLRLSYADPGKRMNPSRRGEETIVIL